MATIQYVTKQQHDRACVRCGYGVASVRASLRCPMCGGTSWRACEPVVSSIRP